MSTIYIYIYIYTFMHIYIYIYNIHVNKTSRLATRRSAVDMFIILNIVRPAIRSTMSSNSNINVSTDTKFEYIQLTIMERRGHVHAVELVDAPPAERQDLNSLYIYIYMYMCAHIYIYTHYINLY